MLIERGLATVTGRVYQRELLGEFLYFYGHTTLTALNSDISLEAPHNWLSAIVRKPRKVFHPIRHLLLFQFLGISIGTFLPKPPSRGQTGDLSYQPFGTGPWLCLNPAADHYHQPVVTHLEISLCGDTKKPVGKFSCSCGFIYCRTGPDCSQEDAYRIGKIKAVGSVWQQKLQYLVEIEQLGLRETARRLHVDPRTINRYVQSLELTARWRSLNIPQSSDLIESPSTASISSNKSQTYHQNIWLALQAEHPQASKTALRRLAPATYIWLYRNDQEWLTQNSPALKTSVRPNNRVDWQLRDEQILAEVKEAVQNLLAAEKPVRITVSKVAKAIGHLALIEQHLDQLPLTRVYLESVVETIEDFQIRRVQWAAKILNQQSKVIEPWKIIRLAGLKPGYSEKVGRAIAFEITRTFNKEELLMISET